MPEEWKPNAPNVNQEFQKNAAQKEQQIKERREMVTKMQATKLENERVTPNSTHEPTPPGGAKYTADYQQASIEREQRIKAIKERMSFAQEQLRKGFDSSRK